MLENLSPQDVVHTGPGSAAFIRLGKWGTGGCVDMNATYILPVAPNSQYLCRLHTDLLDRPPSSAATMEVQGPDTK
jgi:hypothetical protein